MFRRLFGRMSSTLDVPPFSTYYPSRDQMDRDQRAFYDHFVRSWRKGKPAPVQGQISYIFCYVYDVIRSGDMKFAADWLSQIINVYRMEDKIENYCSGWRSDCYVVLKNYARALEVYPKLTPGQRSSSQTDQLLTLKLLNNQEIKGRDVVTLFGPKTTQYVKDRIEDLSVYIDAQIAEIVEHSGGILDKWRLLPSVHRHPYPVFSGVPFYFTDVWEYDDFSIKTSGPKQFEYDAPESFSFSYSDEIRSFCERITRQAENALREDDGVPRIGEGWMAETKLYYEMAQVFSGVEIEQHAQPKWLGRQHLDIFIPDFSVAIEYQGIQHDQAIDYFGGIEAYEETKKRDARKRQLCKRHGITLIEVRPGYDLRTIVSMVESHRQKRE